MPRAEKDQKSQVPFGDNLDHQRCTDNVGKDEEETTEGYHRKDCYQEVAQNALVSHRLVPPLHEAFYYLLDSGLSEPTLRAKRKEVIAWYYSCKMKEQPVILLTRNYFNKSQLTHCLIRLVISPMGAE